MKFQILNAEKSTITLGVLLPQFRTDINIEI